ncbi:unnamed protein product [Rotaria sp. Silwood2]|nr:unnamed protein product [Rotaria sp. Silwood2]CAF2668213.1 unnamed protein product [Rotaria sp. Silwood2]CAF2945368.1 unnamed protein product [Rotaria sp. Silwood2]CAF3089918.1 unnamed protein product [Rotaria sp. Silwood2]CAF4038562.1 unnamed protein product [Rotaria sp. Silwood2]
MARPNETIFSEVWPKCFVIFMAIIELIAVLILFITEFGNVGVNFWTTNVFAGGWCGLIMLIHVILLFATGCGSPKPLPAFRAVIVTVIAILACITLIGFDAYFIAQPTTCLLTSSCTTNAASNATFSYNFRQWFFTLMNNWGPFKTDTESQAKLFVHAMQLGIGGLCFLLCIIYFIIYYVCANKSKVQVEPVSQSQQPQTYYAPPQQLQAYYAPPQQSYYAPSQQSFYGPPPQQYPQPPAPAYRRNPYVRQAVPGQIPWNSNRRY